VCALWMINSEGPMCVNSNRWQTVILVGGLGANRYLHQEITNAMGARGEGVSVVQAMDAWSAVCRGATIWGLEHSPRQAGRKVPPTVKSRVARCSYGIRIDEPWDWKKHWNLEHYFNADGQRVAKYRMIWMIEKVSARSTTFPHLCSNLCYQGRRAKHDQNDNIEQGRQCEWTKTEDVDVSWYHLFSPSKKQFEHTLWYSESETPPVFFNSNSE